MDRAGLVEAEERLQRWRSAVAAPAGPAAADVLHRVRERLGDDLDAPGALRAVDRWVEEQRLRGGTDTSAPGLVAAAADALLGVAL